jgi:DNA-binding MurR/RpiR family transcriptional regulator
MLAGRRGEIAGDDVLRSCFEGAVVSVRSASDEILPANFETAAALLADHRMRICCLGGRFSRHLAAILKWHLQQIRPGTELLGEADVDLADRLVDMGARDVLTVYDFRRYQTNVVQFANEATMAGCKTILITDKWKSPIARSAKVVFTVPVESVSPFDTMVPALVLTEALIAATTRRLEGKLGERLEMIEKYRSARNVTFEAPSLRAPKGEKPGSALVKAAAKQRRSEPGTSAFAKGKGKARRIASAAKTQPRAGA